MDTQTLALGKQHEAAGAVMGQEGGWTVPMSYAGAIAEAEAVRRRAGVMDVSSIGRLRIRGDGALTLLERVCTADVARQEDDSAILTCLCNDAGGILDVGYLVRLESFWVLTTSPGNREKVLTHLRAQDVAGVRIDDQTAMVGQLCVAGPAGAEILDAVLPVPVGGLAAGQAKMSSMFVAKYIATATGWVDEWSLEVMLPNLLIGRAWQFITAKAGENALPPVGAAARDILRIEAGLVRYGHEVNETIDPITAGLSRCVSLDHDFLGAAAVAKVADHGPARQRVLMKVTGEAIPRQGTAVLDADGTEAGTVTSGTFSPKHGAVLAMAYVPRGSDGALRVAGNDAEILRAFA